MIHILDNDFSQLCDGRDQELIYAVLEMSTFYHGDIRLARYYYKMKRSEKFRNPREWDTEEAIEEHVNKEI